MIFCNKEQTCTILIYLVPPVIFMTFSFKMYQHTVGLNFEDHFQDWDKRRGKDKKEAEHNSEQESIENLQEIGLKIL